MIHELKIKSNYFELVKHEQKKFELRKDDRDFNVGDVLKLNEIDENGNPTGNYVKRKVMYILRDCPEYGLQDGYCILSLGFMREM